AEERFDNSGRVPAGEIISQDVPPGTAVPRDSTVSVVVSRGQDLVPVPDVRGFSRDEAERELRGDGFQIEIREYRPDRVVVNVSPGVGQRVLRGSTVVVTFGGGGGGDGDGGGGGRGD